MWADPNILFYVSDKAPFDTQGLLDEQIKDMHIAQRFERDFSAAKAAVAVYESLDGRNLIREHKFVAKL